MSNAIIERVSRLVPAGPVPSRLVSPRFAGFAYKTRMRASPVITVEVTGYWLTLRSSGGLPWPMVHRLDWLPHNGATSVSARELASVNREAITRRGKNVMRYYATTAVPFNEVRRGPRAKGSRRLIPCRRNQSDEFNVPVRQLRTSIVLPSSANRRYSHRNTIRKTIRES